MHPESDVLLERCEPVAPEPVATEAKKLNADCDAKVKLQICNINNLKRMIIRKRKLPSRTLKPVMLNLLFQSLVQQEL